MYSRISFNQTSHTAKIVGIIGGMIGLLAVFIIPVSELQIEASLFIVDININDSFSMYDMYETLDRYEFSTTVIQISIASISLGSLLLILGFLTTKLIIIGSLLQAFGTVIFIYEYGINAEDIFENVESVTIEPDIAIFLLIIVPILTLIFGIIELKNPDKFP